jgi:glycosyltransferase involved in cell wall biosynthesis
VVVWIFNPFDDIPGEGKPQRYWSLASELSKQGHEVVWWSSAFSHRRKLRRELPLDAESLQFTLRLIECEAYSKNISLGRIYNHQQWGKQLVQDALLAVDRSELRPPDLIIASMPPMEGPIAALALRAHFKCRIVTDVMDAWPETLLQAVPKWAHGLGRLALLPYTRMLRRACSEADAVSAQSKAFSSFAKKHGATGDIHVCYLGAERVARREGDCPQPLKTEALSAAGLDAVSSSYSTHGTQSASNNQQPSKLRLLYLGSMGSSYDLDTLVSAWGELLKQGNSLELHFAGEGEKLEQLKSETVDCPVGSVCFHGFLQEHALADLLSSCDVGIIPMFIESGVALPYKAGDYLAAGLTIINSLDGELKELLDAFNCGIFYEAGDVSSLVRAMSHYIELPAVEMEQQRLNAKSLFSAKFDRAIIYPPFANWLAGLVKSKQ